MMLSLSRNRVIGVIRSSSLLKLVPTAPVLKRQRLFTSFHSPLRPSLVSLSAPQFPHIAGAIVLRPPDDEALDLVPKITTHPALSAIQIRCGPRNTYDPSHFVRKRRHGFLSRIKTRKGRMTLARRRAKKRSTLSH